ncbi:MAG: hypothetical protein IBX39_09995, partial [Candidatus Methanoperedenaceae archaeon]|nr:hypothetical protein [Candidatus Methanoperedenaceae archaeon]
MNINQQDDVMEGHLNTTFPSRTVLGINIPVTCRGCGTVQSCNLRCGGMEDLCTGKQPAPEGSIRIGDTFIQIRKDLKKHFPAPTSFQWIDDPNTRRYEQRIKDYLTNQLGFAWIKKADITVTDYEITITGHKTITIEREDDEFARLTIEGQRDLILNAKTTPNGEYWYINHDLIKRKVLRKIHDTIYIPERALSHNREDEDFVRAEDYSVTPFLDSESDAPFWIEQEEERNLKPTQYGFEVVTRKQKKAYQERRQEIRQEKFIVNHGFRLQDKLRSLLDSNPAK